jgi:O-antigen ligase
VGVGLNNFPNAAPAYVNELESVEAARYIAESRLVVHNSYLEMLAETGVVGLTLFLAFVAACTRAAWLAGRRLEALGEHGLAGLAQSVLVATVATLAASAFVSHGADERLWILLALGPAALGIAERLARRPAPGLSESPDGGGAGAGAGRSLGVGAHAMLARPPH